MNTLRFPLNTLLLGLLFTAVCEVQAQPLNGPSPETLDFETIDGSFSNPPAQYRVIQYFMNRNLDATTAEELQSYGIGGIQHSVAYKNYLRDEYEWEKTGQNIALANQNDLRVWIHDERGYPSGAAGGLVVEGHPEYEARGLVRITKSGNGTGPVTWKIPGEFEFIFASISKIVNDEPDFENSQKVQIVGNTIETTCLEGEWQLSAFGIKILDEDTQGQQTIEQFGNTGHYPNLLNKDATQRFVELTHQNYADHLEDIGSQVNVFYTGEANLMTTYWQYDGTEAEYPYIPWENGLPARFKTMHGYELLPVLNALYEGISTASKTVRLHFYQTVADMFTSAYVNTISNWCENHGVQSLGHLLLEEYLPCHVIYYGNMLKALRNFHIPACDIPVARSEEKKWEFWMAKFISSAAYLENKTSMVNGLLDPIIGGYGRNDLSPDVKYLKRTINMNFLCGLNQISTYIPYKDYSPEQYRHFNEYLGRLALMLRGAKNEASVAMYYPINTFQSRYVVSPKPWNRMVGDYKFLQEPLDELAAGMLQNGIDFNYVTDDALQDASISENAIQVGNHAYSAIVMPRVEVIPLDVLKKLKEISEAGIPVHWVNTLPSMGIKNKEHAEVAQLAESLQMNHYPMSDLKKVRDQAFELEFSSTYYKLSVSKFSRDDHSIYFVINDREEEITITAESAGHQTVKIYNPANGKIQVKAFPVSEKISGYESLFFVVNKEGFATNALPAKKEKVPSLKLYPNPVASEVRIEVPPKSVGSSLMIMDSLGNLVEYMEIKKRLISKNMSSYNPGIYFVRLQNEPGSEKLILL